MVNRRIVEWLKRGLLIIGLLLISLIMVRQMGAQEEKDWRFGIVEAYTARNSARELKIGWTRVGFHWADVQAGGPDTWTPGLSDEEIDEQLAEGREVIGLLIGIPDWARDEAGLPAGLWLDHDDPANLWANYVREVVTRYDGRINHWIIWNEPDIDASEVAHSWDGGVDDFYQLQQVAYLVAKEANPDSVIHLAAFTYWADFDAGREQYMARLLDRILADPQAAEHNYFFDVATAHLYFQPDQVYELLDVFLGIMRERGLAQPIWLVETNAPAYDDPEWPVPDPVLAVSNTEQAAYIPQALASAMAGGAERIGVYKLRDTEGDRAANPEPFGLLRLDGSRRLAFNTYREAIRFMRGVKTATRERWDEVGQFRLEQEDRITTVLFARLPQPQQVEIEAIAPTARLVDMWGQEQVLEAEDGYYNIDLQQALCTQTIGDYCMIGGTVYYLIQAIDGGFPPEENPPVVPPPPTITIALSPTMTASPSPTATPMPSATASLTPRPTATDVSKEPTAAATAVSPTEITQTKAIGALTTEPDEGAVASTRPSQNASDGQAPSGLAALILILILGGVGVGLLLIFRNRTG
ncbi:MAG: hypothetical protein ACK2UF_05010 [Candidatus Promineifilaceae bacterium]|jgi:hypothetical protein